ncbi:MAG: hypothetical protein K2J29_07380 [Muribaculaceae bacterium]|nr:hypothetical protein [Muribaculaceae bacterium]
MTDHYVSFETAQALKLLGFAEKVNHGYSEQIRIEPDLSLSYDNTKEVHSKDPKNYNDSRKGADKGIYFYSAPRLDQAAEWLLKKKGYYIEVLFCAGNGVDQSDGWIYNIVGIWSYEIEHDYTAYALPEFALSAGIDKAFELLEKKK